MDFKTLASAGSTLAAGATTPCDALLVVLAGSSLPAELNGPLGQALQQATKSGDLVLKTGQSLHLYRAADVKAPRVHVVVAADGGSKALAKAAHAGVSALKSGPSQHLALLVLGAELGASHAQALAVAAADALYQYRLTKPSATPPSKINRLSVLCTKAQAKAVDAGLVRGSAIAEGVSLARELANRPGNHCTPTVLAEQARQLGKSHGLSVQVLERKDVAKLGMGAFLAVAQASHEAPKFIVASYRGAGKADAPVVLVGKGITFDTGGVSLKPAAEMDEMKFDMGGAASVLGTLRAVAQLKPKINLVGIIPSCENMPGGGAVKPGDVVTSMSGQTIEILNTDAEGRLILCDALTYAERFKPAAVVDIATLTGACMIALGGHRSGLFSSDDALAAELLAAGEAALDPAWRMPLDDEYDEALKSNFADMGNVGGRAGGAITAAMFLKRYTRAYRWAHLDIAGTAWKSGAAKGGTGRPVALLTEFVLARAG